MAEIINLREASGSDYIQITPFEALEMAIEENPDMKQVVIVMIGKDNELTWLQGGGLNNSDIVWHLEKVKHYLLAR